jgi:hypothetical protein
MPAPNPNPAVELTAQVAGVRAALYSRFGSIFAFTNMAKDVIEAPKIVAQRDHAEAKDKNLLNFISLWRTSGQRDLVRQQGPRAQGIDVSWMDEHNVRQSTVIKAVPDAMAFDFWVWSTEPKYGASVEREFLFWPYENPCIELSLTLGGASVTGFKCPLVFGDKLTYDGMAESKYDKGRDFHIWTGSFVLEGWVFKTEASTLITQIICRVSSVRGSFDDITITVDGAQSPAVRLDTIFVPPQP